jgi:hypothetical protein
LTRISKSYFDKKLRVGKLDSALLFLSSTVGIMFAVIRAAINPTASIVTSIPLITLGIVLPFYYGYVRGALVRSSAVDRYRGWIFFLVGLGAFGLNITIEWMNQVFPLYLGRLSYLADVPVAIIAVLFAYFVARKFHRFIFQVLSERSSPLISRAANGAALSAMFFAAVGSNVATIGNLDIPSSEALLLPLLLLLGGGAYFLKRSNRWAGYANSNARYSFEQVTGKWYGKRLPSWSGDALYYSGIAFFLVGTLYFVTTATTVASVFDFFYELVGAIFLMVTGMLLADRVGKKEVLRVQ